MVEAGPDSFVSEKPWAADLCRALGLGDQLIGSNDADRKTYILTRRRLVEMPDDSCSWSRRKILPTGLSPLFSWKTKLRMARELFQPPHAVEHDESVAEFVRRHYGPEMVDRLADPLLSGVYGGEADSLSVCAVLPAIRGDGTKSREPGTGDAGGAKEGIVWPTQTGCAALHVPEEWDGAHGE